MSDNLLFNRQNRPISAVSPTGRAQLQATGRLLEFTRLSENP
jgi:hypothetical protein